MKRSVSTLLAGVLALFLLCPTATMTEGMGSPERGDVRIDEADVPLIELPAVEVIVSAEADASGEASAAIGADRLLEAAAAVKRGDAVCIAVILTGPEGAGSFRAVMPGETLRTIAEETGAWLELEAGDARLSLPKMVLASIVEQAAGGDVTVRLSRQTAEAGGELLREALGADGDIARIGGGSVTEVEILFGGAPVAGWDGDGAVLALPAGPEGFEAGKGYTVFQIGADRSVVEHVGRCVERDGGLYVEISIAHLSTFVVLAGAVEEGLSTVPSPLTAKADGDGGAASGRTAQYLAAGLLAAGGAAAGIAAVRRTKSRRRG